MAEQAVLEATFRLPEEILDRVQDSARDRRQQPDQVVAEALGYVLPPSRKWVEHRVQHAIERLSAKTDEELSLLAESALSPAEERRIAMLLAANRERKLTQKEESQLEALHDKTVEISADRVLAGKILRDRKRARRLAK